MSDLQSPVAGLPPAVGRKEGGLCSELWDMVKAFSLWLERAGYASYDPYDLWGTRYGVAARRCYYWQASLGMPLVAPLLLLEVLCPGARALFVEKQRFPTADAQLLLAFLNLHALTGDPKHLEKARALAEDLLKSSIPGYSGHCWGYPFDWQNNKALWSRNTPLITATPYCFEAFLHLHDATGEARYLDIAASAAKFVAGDLHDTPTSADAAAGSYSPLDQSQVVNASAYRAFVLFESAHRFGVSAYREKAWRNLNFILQCQRSDGSWLYGMDSPQDHFIDHFHTCFVLKNLHKLNARLASEPVRQAILNGYSYYRRQLFDPDDTPQYFAIQPRTQIVTLEMYNVAEAITLGALLRDEIPESCELAVRLARRLRREWQLPDGHFVTRLYRGGFKHTLPFLRWPQAQTFYALTNLLVAALAQHGRREPATGCL